jgi:predicted MFS family arabinose efflux permease
MDLEGHDLNEDGPLESDLAFFMRSLKSPGVIMPIISCILGTIFLLFNEPIISDHLIEMGMSPDYIGFTFAASCLSYAVAAPIVGFLTKHFSKESLTLFAYVFSSFALFI